MQSYSYFVAFDIRMSAGTAEEKRTPDDCVDEVDSDDDKNKQLVFMKWIFDSDKSIEAMI